MRSAVLENAIPTEIREDLTVSGDIHVRGEVKVFPGVVLTVKPGTKFLFEPYDPDGDGVNDSRLVIEGRLVARGEPGAPIVFTSASENPEPGDWLEIGIERSEGTVLEYCVVEYSRYGLHVHFSSGVVANSIFRKNIDGTRFGNSRFRFGHNRIESNIGKGVNLRNSAVVIEANIFTGNRHGIFLFEQDAESVISENRFFKNLVSDIRFGDFYEGENPRFWHNIRPEGSSLVIKGRAGLKVSGDGLKRDLSGPYSLEIETAPLWQTEIGSFIDASPVLISGHRIAIASWQEGISVLDEGDGRVLSQAAVGDVVDATPLLTDNALYFPAWDRKIYRYETENEKLTSTASWSSSMADDHRQAKPVMMNSHLVQGLWNGELWSLRPAGMKVAWRTALDGPVRGAVAIDIASSKWLTIWVGTEGGSLYNIDKDGVVLSRIAVGEAVRTTPALIDRTIPAVVTTGGIVKVFSDDDPLWTRKLPGPGTYASPVAFGEGIRAGLAVADGAGNVSLFDRKGALLWRSDLGSAVHSLGMAESFLWAGTGEGILAVMDKVTGKILYRYKADGAIHSTPVFFQKQIQVYWKAPGKAQELITKDPGKMVWAARDGVVRAHEIEVNTSIWDGPAQ